MSGRILSFGGVVVRDDGRLLLREVAGGFDGETWSFAKGRAVAGEAPEETALREVLEETGQRARVLAEVPGRYRGAASDSQYYLMAPVGPAGAFDRRETSAVRWVTRDEASALLATSRKASRELAVLEAAWRCWLALDPRETPRAAPSEPASPLREALACAIDAARAAGARWREARAQGPLGAGVDNTAALERSIEEQLRRSFAALEPSWSFFGEETQGALPPVDGLGWLVDPLDGTAAWREGLRGAAISIALLRDRVPVLGVVYAFDAPDDDGVLYSWAEGAVLQRNGVPVTRAPLPQTLLREHLVLVHHRSDEQPDEAARRVAPARFAPLPSIAHRLARVAAGEADATVSTSGPAVWDVAGGHALLRAAGEELRTFDGRSVRYESAGVGNVVGASEAVAGALAAATRAPSSTRGRTSALRAPVVEAARWPTPREAGVLSRAQGCLLGQLAGDALGSQVEFLSAQEIRRRHPGGLRAIADGGTWNTLAGQPTDDSELALSLARCLVEAGSFDEERVRASYVAWLESGPFDVGGTTSAGLRGRPLVESAANGALMRVSPLGIAGVRCDGAALAELARSDARITHPNTLCQDASAVFVVATSAAVREGLAPRAVYEFARTFARDAGLAAGVREALERASDGPPKDMLSQQGYVLLALQNAFAQLLREEGFEAGLRATVELGGDTDTNGAIAGALLGAVYGRAAVPEPWQRAVLTCRPLAGLEGVRQPRPARYWPVDALRLAEQLLLVAEGVAAGAALAPSGRAPRGAR